VTIIGEVAPVTVILSGVLVTVYEVIGSLEKLGGSNETLAVVAVSAVADVTAATVGAPLTLAVEEALIVIGLFYLTLVLPIVDLTHT
jgi:hypothetical protein